MPQQKGLLPGDEDGWRGDGNIVTPSLPGLCGLPPSDPPHQAALCFSLTTSISPSSSRKPSLHIQSYTLIAQVLLLCIQMV